MSAPNSRISHSDRPWVVMRASDVMSRPVLAVTDAATLPEAVQILLSHGYTTLPVVDDDGRLTGVLTEDSLAEAYLSGLLTITAPAETTTSDPTPIPSQFVVPPVSVAQDTSIPSVIEVMLRTQLRAVPVVSAGHPVGMVSWRDVFAAIEGHPR
ncbi:HPP family protein [Rhodococcus sp. NPDC059234]|uniref:CBS domain-containing protein n=1 Tax=Rhodococcus sp. NPDC059234 TaxID=3346781 RepID=UPI00366C327F